MAVAWFDGDNLNIDIPAGLMQAIDVQVDLYSDWKEYVKITGNSTAPAAFDTTGGDPVGGGQVISPYFFLRNDLGWRIVPNVSGDSTISFTGNLFPRDSTLPLVDLAASTASHLWQTVISPQSLTTGGLTAQQTRDSMSLEHTDLSASIDTKLNNNAALSAAAL